jgi:hypothetical protein
MSTQWRDAKVQPSQECGARLKPAEMSDCTNTHILRLRRSANEPFRPETATPLAARSRSVDAVLELVLLPK